jgi:Zn finger protein HypA/HybF involved in hydrogenase expression
MICKSCGIEFHKEWRSKYSKNKPLLFCSNSCSNRRVRTEEIKEKIRRTMELKYSNTIKIIVCSKCNCVIQKRNKAGICRKCLSNPLTVKRKRGVIKDKKDYKKNYLQEKNRELFELWKTGENSDLFGAQTGYSKGELNSCLKIRIKAFLIEDQEGKCKECGITNIWNNKPLTFVLDHIDGEHTNNIRNNLRLLCPNCDSQQITFKSKNKGKGRHSNRILMRKYSQEYKELI